MTMKWVSQFLIILFTMTAGSYNSLADVPVRILDFTSVDLAHFPAPPAVGDLNDERDLQTVRTFQQIRTRARCAQAEEESGSTRTFFENDLSPNELGLVAVLLGTVWDETDLFVHILKNRWNRPRPFMRDASISLCVSEHFSGSYPSGHAANSRAMARVLAMLFPDRAQKFFASSDRVGENRVIGGVHYPSDVEAGKMLADKVFEALMVSPKFREQFVQTKHSLSSGLSQ